MPTIYGQPAVAIEQPDGSTELYLLEPVPGSRAWEITSAKGQSYRVTESRDGRLSCDCPAMRRYTKYGCVHVRGNFMLCKHAAAIHDMIHDEIDHGRNEATDRGRPGEGLPGCRRGGGLPPHERGDAPPARQERPVPATTGDE